MGGYGPHNSQLKRLELAASLNKEAAYKSASYGGFQIMGSNFKAAGYDNVFDFAQAMLSKDEDKHLEAFTNFVMDNKTLLKAIQSSDWTTFAKTYNGPDYKVNKYDTKMEEAYGKFLKTPLESKKSKESTLGRGKKDLPPPVHSSLKGL